MLLQSKKSILFAIPIVVFFLFSFEEADRSLYVETQPSSVQLDSFPPLPDELIGKEVDTIFTFDPATLTETISYKLQEPQTDIIPKINQDINYEIDTLFIFDPVTKKETIKIIKNPSGN